MILEVGNGLLRKVIVESFVDDLTARQIGVAMGSVMILLVAYLTVGWFHARRRRLLVVGLIWASLTLAFEIFLGRAVMGLSWARIQSDYDPLQGGLMPLGLLVMACAPLAGAWLRRGVRKRRRASRPRLREVRASG
ncbi:MAG: hypothetical protein JNL04_03440 [Rhodospirillaceae bacterium]|nr:hypothetical protein [Rhodospirillaceae bacterium]